MKNILQIARNDLHSVRQSVIALVVLFGLVVIPSFFGWFNVLSSWDPFGNVKNLKVAVANSDEGFHSTLLPVTINIGDQVISNLRANSDLNWVFTSGEEAVEGTKSGEYYAALVLPPNFSESMMTFLSPEAAAAEIEYYSNEKENALSPKITEEAASEVSTTINDAFTKTLDEVGLTLISALAKDAGSPDSQAALSRLARSVDDTANDLSSAASTVEMFSSLISSSKVVLGSASSLAESSQDAVNSASGAIAQGAQSSRNLLKVLRSATGAIPAALAQTSSSYDDVIDQVSKLNTSAAKESKAAVKSLNTLSSGIGKQIDQYSTFMDSLNEQSEEASDAVVADALDQLAVQVGAIVERQAALQERIDDAATSLSETDTSLADSRTDIVALAKDTKSALNNALASYNSSLKPKLEKLAATLDSVNSGFGSITSNLSAAVNTLSGTEDSTLALLTSAENATKKISKDLDSSAEVFVKLSEAIKADSETGDFKEVQQFIGSNPAILAGELSSPVGLKRIPVFAVDTFGAQMAPFYTVLGLWVGALLLAVIFRSDVLIPQRRIDSKISKTHEYFGRYAIFFMMGFLQSSLLYIGLIGFVGVQPVHPLLLILAGWVMSTVFTLITYTLVLSFGEIGKALLVFLLVVQISAGGGAYPLSVLPQWFQNISPWLPVTHATNAIRSAIAGIYDGDYWKDLGMLLLFVLPILLIGLVLRLPVMKFNNNLTEAIESTKLM